MRLDRHVALTAQSAVNATWRLMEYLLRKYRRMGQQLPRRSLSALARARMVLAPLSRICCGACQDMNDMNALKKLNELKDVDDMNEYKIYMRRDRGI